MDEQRDLETRIEMSFWARGAAQRGTARNPAGGVGEPCGSCCASWSRRRRRDKAIAKKHDREEILELLGAMIDGISLHALLYPDRLPPKRQAAVMEFALQLLK